MERAQSATYQVKAEPLPDTEESPTYQVKVEPLPTTKAEPLSTKAEEEAAESVAVSPYYNLESYI